MSFQDLVTAAQKHFPDLKIKYKDQSWFMKLIATLLFFNKGFLTDYASTIGSDVYFPTESLTRTRPVSAAVVLLHELIHVNDAKKIGKPLFGFLYLTPQIFVLLCLPLFLLSWKIALPLVILFALPLPSFFRMYFEKRAYLTSLYAVNALSKRLDFNPLLEKQEDSYLKNFQDSTYYFMWPIGNLKKDFDEAVAKVKEGKRPYEDPIFDIIDELVTTL